MAPLVAALLLLSILPRTPAHAEVRLERTLSSAEVAEQCRGKPPFVLLLTGETLAPEPASEPLWIIHPQGSDTARMTTTSPSGVTDLKFAVQITRSMKTSDDTIKIRMRKTAVSTRAEETTLTECMSSLLGEAAGAYMEKAVSRKASAKSTATEQVKSLPPEPVKPVSQDTGGKASGAGGH